MKDKEEIKEYLNVGLSNGESKLTENFIKGAEEIEKKYSTKLDTGDYGYGIECDVCSSFFILEDENEVEYLKPIETINGVTFYKKIYRK